MADNSQSRTARRKQKKSNKKPIWKKILLITSIVVLALGLGVGVLFAYYIATAPEIDASQLSDPLSSKIYDKDGELFADLGSEQRSQIEFGELPPILIDAVTATEDSRFFTHSGIDLLRIGGAIKANITNGFGSEGASTITQQVVEKSFLSPEKKISLKVQEQWLALKLEREYSKEAIMEMYLNKIHYGNNSYGVAKAAQNYFGKTDLSELTLPEAAILAGLPQRPSAYNPFENPDLTKERMNTVLDLMVRHEKITQEEADEAREVDIPSLLREDRPDSSPYEAFLQQIRDEISKKVDGADIYTDGLKIYTTLDTNAQEYVEFLLSDSEDNPINYPEPVEDENGNPVDVQAGMVLLDTKNGAIRAIGGARGGLENDGHNFAIDGEGRQPGSTFKPIVAYGPAIEHNQLSTYHQINDDGPFDIAGTDSQINNWDGSSRGWMSMRYALSESLNVPAVKTLEENGSGNAKSFAEGLGIEFANDNVTIGDAIGGTGTGVTPLELAGAYRAFGNQGIYNEPYAVTEVEFPDGKTIDLKPKAEAAMSDYTAYMITDMLKTAVEEGTGTAANVSGLPVAGKTGTTNLKDKNGSPDSWFSGYTTNYTLSIWTGYGDSNQRVLPDTKIPHALFKHTMSEISKDIDTPDFVKPDSVVEVEVEKGSRPAKLPSDFTPSSEIVTELFVKGYEPDDTSEKYDQLDPVNNLTAEYDEDSDSIQVEWDYNSDEDVSFEISASEDGGQMNGLSSTEDTSFEISNVEPGAEYEIQVVVVSNEHDSITSEPSSTKVSVPEEQENIPSIDNLEASYNAENNMIDVSWGYNGPPAEFEVDVNGQTQTVGSNGIEITNISPGEYNITITPIGQNGANSDVRGESQSTTINVESDDDNNDEENADNNDEVNVDGEGLGGGNDDNDGNNEDDDAQDPEDQ
ncbi:PBP1A family penicillin-binding protein [Virgibacillus byunsanensis]|uniref:PBP1A family penicillin-binding protein n=1 Tax=Virgibacillus byunsanensis TaxID=570945 RepID=A0ABW3LJS7_9BACI